MSEKDSVPARPLWADLEHEGLRAMPVMRYCIRIGHGLYDENLGMKCLDLLWDRPRPRRCPPGRICVDPLHYWQRKVLKRDKDVLEFIAEHATGLPPGVSTQSLFSPGLLLEFLCVTDEGTAALRAFRVCRYILPGRKRNAIGWSDHVGETGPTELHNAPAVVQIRETREHALWNGGGEPLILAHLFHPPPIEDIVAALGISTDCLKDGEPENNNDPEDELDEEEVIDCEALADFDRRFLSWLDQLDQWPHWYGKEDGPERRIPVGFDWAAFHRSGIRLAMELKTLVGDRAVVLYKGSETDPGWPPLLELLIDRPPETPSSA